MAKKKTSPPLPSTDQTISTAPRRRTPRKTGEGNTRDVSQITTQQSAPMDIAADDVAAPARQTPVVQPSNDGNGSLTFERIAQAAYQKYLSRGGQHGRDFDDWVEAERELRSGGH